VGQLPGAGHHGAGGAAGRRRDDRDGLPPAAQFGAGPELRFIGATLDAQGVDSWFGAAFVLLTGVGLFELTRRGFLRHWGEIQEFIEKETKRREALA
jgi:hypothetical protein